jgi:ketosteroid isomerase-like protein
LPIQDVRDAMTANGNTALTQRMLRCYSTMDADGLRDILHPEARHTAPGSDFGTDLVGSSVIIKYFKDRVFPAFDRVGFDAVHVWEDSGKDVVIVEWRSHLWPKTGKNYSNDGVFVVEVKDGRIYWVREYFDTQKANQHVSGE